MHHWLRGMDDTDPGPFCDGTCRYAVPAPFFKRRKKLRTGTFFEVSIKTFQYMLVKNATENVELNTKCLINSG